MNNPIRIQAYFKDGGPLDGYEGPLIVDADNLSEFHGPIFNAGKKKGVAVYELIEILHSRLHIYSYIGEQLCTTTN